MIAQVVKCAAKLEAELRIGRVLFDAFLSFGDLLGDAVGAAGIKRGLEFLVIGVGSDAGFEIF